VLWGYKLSCRRMRCSALFVCWGKYRKIIRLGRISNMTYASFLIWSSNRNGRTFCSKDDMFIFWYSGWNLYPRRSLWLTLTSYWRICMWPQISSLFTSKLVASMRCSRKSTTGSKCPIARSQGNSRRTYKAWLILRKALDHFDGLPRVICWILMIMLTILKMTTLLWAFTFIIHK